MSSTSSKQSTRSMQDIMDRLLPFQSTTSQHCYNCGERLASFYSPEEDNIQCASCGRVFSASYAEHAVLPEFTPLEDVDIARGITYYHWTSQENWYKNLPENLPVHLGCKQAAFERMIYFMHENGIRGSFTGQLHLITINDSTPFEDSLRADNQAETCYLPSFSIFEGSVNAMERYVNAVEASGSISLCGTKSMFTIVDSMDAEEAFSG